MLIQQKGLFSIYAAVAQLVEFVPSKHDVAGSSPVDGSMQFQNNFSTKGANHMISLIGGELYQWDTGRIVRIDHDKNATVHEVHFTNKRMDHAYVLKTYTEDGATYCKIPNIILQQSYRILCYEVCENSDGEETIANMNFDVIKRNKPEDYVYTEQEHFTVVALENRLTKVEESAHAHKNKDALDSITNENIEAWNSNAEIAHTHENKEQLDTITEADLETWRNLKTKTFYADFDVNDGKNIIAKVTPDEIVAAYESGQNVIARIVSKLYMSGYVTLVRPFIIDRNREISFSDVVVFGSVTSGKMVQLCYYYDSKKWYFDISDWLLDKKHADEKYIDGYWGTDVAGKYLAISNAGVVYAANPPSDSSNNAVTYAEQTLTDAQKAQARTNIGAIDASSLETYAKKTEIPTVPTKVSAFENDSGYLTEHQSLEAYAKKTEIPTVPTKTSQLTNDSGYLTEHQSLDAYAKKTEIPTVPTKVSAFENDSGYLTEHQSLEAYAKKTEIPTVPATDSELSATSTNPVQNKIIKAELDKKLESIPVDGTTIKLNDQGQLTLALSNANGVSF